MADETIPNEGTTIYVDVPGGAAAPAVAVATPATTDDAPQAGVEDLKRQLAEQKQARADAERGVVAEREQRMRATAHAADAERRAVSSASAATEARQAESDAQFHSIVNALTAYEKQRDALKGKYASLLEEGKFTEAADLNSEIAEVASRITSLRDGKTAAEDARKRAADAPAKPAAPAAAPVDEAAQQEQWLNAQAPHNAAWIRQHRDRFFGDKNFAEKAIAASNYALKVMGHAGGSDAYFRHIEEAVGLRQRDDAVPAAPTYTPAAPAAPAPSAPLAPSSAAAASQTRSSPTPAAPPSRTAPGAAPGQPGGTAITLSADERHIARMTFTPDICNVDPKTGIDPKTGRVFDPEVRFAMQKAELMREGKWEGARGR